MNKNILLLICFCFASSLQSQTLVKENNFWSNLIESAIPGNYTFHFQKIKGDTTIAGTTYKKLLGTTNANQTNWAYEGAIREDATSKVYYRHIGSLGEHLIYNFSLVKNEIFVGYYNEIQYSMKVDSVVNVQLLNGEIRKQFYFTVVSGLYGYENWIQEIGSDNGLTYSGVYMCITDYYPSLNCFTENGIVKIYNNNLFPCYSNVGVEDNPEVLHSVIYPDPVNENATITLDRTYYEKLTLCIFNSLGVKASEYQTDGGSTIMIHRNGLPSGLYVYHLYSGSEKITTGKFIFR